MILNPFTAPIYTRLIEIDNNFVTNIFNKMLLNNCYGWSESSLIFLKKQEEEIEDKLINGSTFDINLILKLLEQLNTFNKYEDNINFYNSSKNIENIIITYLNNLQTSDSKNFFEIKKIINKIKNINLHTNNKENIEYLNIREEVINIFEQFNNKNFNNLIKSNSIINNKQQKLFSYNTKLLNYKNSVIKNHIEVNDKKVSNHYKNEFKDNFKIQLLSSKNNEFESFNKKEATNNIHNKNIFEEKLLINVDSYKENFFEYIKNLQRLIENKNEISNQQLQNFISSNEILKKTELEVHYNQINRIFNNMEKRNLINQGSFIITDKIINSNLNINEDSILNYSNICEEKIISSKDIINNTIKNILIDNQDIDNDNSKIILNGITNRELDIKNSFKKITNINTSKFLINLIENSKFNNPNEVLEKKYKSYILNDENITNSKFLNQSYIIKRFEQNNIILLNNNSILQKIIDKDILFKSIINNTKTKDINSKIILKINKNTKESIFEKELLNYVENYKKFLFEDIKQLIRINYQEKSKTDENIFKLKKISFNKEILKQDYIEIYENETDAFLNTIKKRNLNNKKLFNAIDILEKRKNSSIISEINNKQKKILNITFKENKILEKIINNKFTLNELQYEIKEIKNEFIEQVLLKNLNSNLINNENNTLEYSQIYNKSEKVNEEYLKTIKKDIINNKNILYSKLLNNIKKEDFIEYLKSIDFSYLKNISNLKDFEEVNNTINNSKDLINNIITKRLVTDRYENNKNSNYSKIILNEELNIKEVFEKVNQNNKSKSLINKDKYKISTLNFVNDYIIRRFEKNNIMFGMLLSNSLMVQKIIDKDILLKNIIDYVKTQKLNSKTILKINKENIFEKELFINIENYKSFLYNNIKELEEVIKDKFQVINKENNNVINKKLNNSLFNKEISKKYEKEIYSNTKLIESNNINEEKFNYKNSFNILNKIKNIKDYNTINEINNKQRKLLNITFKENEILEKTINNKITLNELKNELKNTKNNFIEEILLNKFNSNKFNSNKFNIIEDSKTYEEKIEKFKKNNLIISKNNNIITNISESQLINNIKITDVEEYLKSTKLSYLNEIASFKDFQELKNIINNKETIINNKEKVINSKVTIDNIVKNILISDKYKNNSKIFLNKETEINNSKSFINLITNDKFINPIKSLVIKDENYIFKFGNEINRRSSTQSFINHYISKKFEKNNIIPLNGDLLLPQIINKDILFRSTINSFNMKEINSRTILKINKNIKENMFEKELLIKIDENKKNNLDNIKELKENKNIISTKQIKYEKNLKANKMLINNMKIKTDEIINSTINKNVKFNESVNQNKNLEYKNVSNKLNVVIENIEDIYDKTVKMNYKKEKVYSSNDNEEKANNVNSNIDEEKLNKMVNKSIENILEKKLNLKDSNVNFNSNDENEKINYISKKVLSKIKKDLDYEKRKRGLV